MFTKNTVECFHSLTNRPDKPIRSPNSPIRRNSCALAELRAAALGPGTFGCRSSGRPHSPCSAFRTSMPAADEQPSQLPMRPQPTMPDVVTMQQKQSLRRRCHAVTGPAANHRCRTKTTDAAPDCAPTRLHADSGGYASADSDAYRSSVPSMRSAFSASVRCSAHGPDAEASTNSGSRPPSAGRYRHHHRHGGRPAAVVAGDGAHSADAEEWHWAAADTAGTD